MARRKKNEKGSFTLTKWLTPSQHLFLIIILALIGLICLFIAVINLRSSTLNIREDNVEIFEDATSSWNNNGYYTQLDSSSFSVVVSDRTPVTQYPFEKDYSQEIFDDDLESYDPLKFIIDNKNENIITETVEKKDYDSFIALLDINYDFVYFTNYNGYAGSFDMTNIYILKREIYNNVDQSECQEVNGGWDSSTCYIYYKLTSICFQIKLTYINSNYQWEEYIIDDDTDEPKGCDPNNDDWNSLVYEKISLGRNNLVPSVDYSDFTGTIRHWKDPYLVAMEVTDGTLVFGSTSTEFRTSAFLYIIFGILCFIYPLYSLKLMLKTDLRPQYKSKRYEEMERLEELPMDQRIGEIYISYAKDTNKPIKSIELHETFGDNQEIKKRDDDDNDDDDDDIFTL